MPATACRSVYPNLVFMGQESIKILHLDWACFLPHTFNMNFKGALILIGVTVFAGP